jgi:nitronate monooxygenase
MLVESNADDVLTTSEVTGIPANWLLKSLEQTGFMASKVKHQGNFTLDKEIEMLKAWRDIWGAGHGVGGISSVGDVAEIVAEMQREYAAARKGDSARPSLRATLAA